MSLSIYVASLEQNRFFIHHSYSTQFPLQVLVEFEIIYDFPKLYKPVKILEMIPEENNFHLDSVVKQYMLKYGIENVRGGSYVDPILSSGLIDALQLELDNAKKQYPESNEKESAYQFILDNYVYKSWSPEDASKELTRIRGIASEYSQIKDKLNSYIDCGKIKEELDWLREFCMNILLDIPEKYINEKCEKKYYHDVWKWQQENFSVIERYIRLVINCKTLFKQYNTEFPEDSIHSIVYEKPEFLLDVFFLHRNSNLNTSRLCEVNAFCDMMMFMTEKISERIEELMNMKLAKEWENPHIEWSLPKIAYVLERVLT